MAKKKAKTGKRKAKDLAPRRAKSVRGGADKLSAPTTRSAGKEQNYYTVTLVNANIS